MCFNMLILLYSTLEHAEQNWCFMNISLSLGAVHNCQQLNEHKTYFLRLPPLKKCTHQQYSNRQFAMKIIKNGIKC